MENNTMKIVNDKFLPEEQRGNVVLPGWILRLQDYMFEAMRDIRVMLAEVSDQETRAERLAEKVDCKAICEVIGKNVTPIAEIEVDAKGEMVKFTIVLKKGENMPKEMTFVQTSFQIQEDLLYETSN